MGEHLESRLEASTRVEASTRLGQLLLRSRLLARTDLERALALPGAKTLTERLTELGLATEEQVAQTLATQLHIPYIDLGATTIGTESMQYVPRTLAERNLIFPVTVTGRDLHLAMADPLNLDAIRDVEFRSGLRVRPAVATATRIREAIVRGYAFELSVAPILQDLRETAARTAPGAAEPFAGQPVVDLKEQAEITPVVRMVNMLISEGIRTGASDIHIEPGMDGVAVRNRIDGILRDTLTMPREIHAGLVSRLKILAHLDIAERRRPQDGRIRVSTGAHAVDLRVSTLPTHCGEKVVLRLLDGERDVLGLEHLGLEAAQRRILDEALAQPQGSILVTGPTGSGKTSTLYAALSYLKSPGINIVSLENPVEFQIKGVNQVNMNERTGLTFAASLRSIVRQDPDVIMVGEIRDAETAEIAFQAALTGHLVLSTLHTNSASAAVTRLFDLGVEPFLIASSVSLVIAQRLVRRLCVDCREEYDPTPQELERLHLKHQTTPLYRPRGCERCLGTGFKGRVGVFEFMPLDERMRELISARASDAALQREMYARGLVSLVDAAAAKVRSGTTCTDEVGRVILHEEGSRKGCPSCGEQIEASFAVCPACETPLKARCGECQRDLQPQWRVCPFCSAPTRRAPKLAANDHPRGVRRGPSNDAFQPA